MAHACNLRFPTLANAGYSKSQVSRSCKPLRRQQIRVDCAANEDGKGSVVTDDGSKQPSPLKGFKVPPPAQSC